MTTIRTLVSVSLLALALVACQSGEPEKAAPANGPEAAQDATPGPAPEEVTYEPAYPEDVNPEGLSDEDIEQQEGHLHGPDGDHTHDEEEDAGDGHE